MESHAPPRPRSGRRERRGGRASSSCVPLHGTRRNPRRRARRRSHAPSLIAPEERAREAAPASNAPRLGTRVTPRRRARLRSHTPSLIAPEERAREARADLERAPTRDALRSFVVAIVDGEAEAVAGAGDAKRRALPASGSPWTREGRGRRSRTGPRRRRAGGARARRLFRYGRGGEPPGCSLSAATTWTTKGGGDGPRGTVEAVQGGGFSRRPGRAFVSAGGASRASGARAGARSRGARPLPPCRTCSARGPRPADTGRGRGRGTGRGHGSGARRAQPAGTDDAQYARASRRRRACRRATHSASSSTVRARADTSAPRA